MLLLSFESFWRLHFLSINTSISNVFNFKNQAHHVFFFQRSSLFMVIAFCVTRLVPETFHGNIMHPCPSLTLNCRSFWWAQNMKSIKDTLCFIQNKSLEGMGQNSHPKKLQISKIPWMPAVQRILKAKEHLSSNSPGLGADQEVKYGWSRPRGQVWMTF